MNNDLLKFDIPTNKSAIIKVIGVGGGGGNAVRHMFREGIEGVEFIVCNTDAQVLQNMEIPKRIQIGTVLTEGLGAGNKPDVGRQAAIESLDAIVKELEDNTKMVFITAGMGGGTGTGAAPVIAEAAKQLGILTVGIVTIPFPYEGNRRITQAKEGISELSKHVDSLLVINNSKLRDIYGNLGAVEALAKADDILKVATKGIAEIITKEGLINVDFADVKTVMQESGVALMGTGSGTGEKRAEEAVSAAIDSPLLNNNDIKGAKNILLNIVSGTIGATMDEITHINEYIQRMAGNSAELIWGCSIDETVGEKIEVTVIATGFAHSAVPEIFEPGAKEITKILITDDSSQQETKDEEITFEITDTIKDEFEEKIKDAEKLPKEEYNLADKVINEKQTPKIELITDNVFENNYVEEKVEIEITEDAIRRKFQERSKSIHAYTSVNIAEYEDEPAYKRNKVELNFKIESDKTKYSRFTVSQKDEGIVFNENNSYLHDKVD